jgi:predicted  nucleic acid-binding Zn-ribbon protein
MPKPEATQVSPINKELARFEGQIKEMQDAIESVKLKSITDPEDLLKAITAKAKAMQLIPALLDELERMRNKSKVKTDDIKGNKTLSPLEDGTLDE